MSDILTDPEFETRVRRAMHTLAESHQPSPLRLSTNDDRPDRPFHHRWYAVAAAFALVVGGVVAVVAVAGRDTALAPTDTEPSLPAPDGTPNADGDGEIDPGRLRFAEPLPDDVVAFIDDPSLPAPRVEDPQDTTLSVGGPIALPLDDPPDSVDVVAMDGAELLMRGTILDIAADSADFSGPTVDVGVDGARYVDEDRGAIVIPLETGELRIVGPDDYFALGGGGPHIDEDALLAIARAVGTTPIDEVDALPGFLVYRGSIGGQDINPIGYGTGITVRHGAGGAVSTTITRLAEPPTALDVIAIANALTRGSIGTPTIGDVTLFDGGQFYIELVSPVDLLIVTDQTSVEDGIIAAIDFAPVDRLDEAFDGTVEAVPPRDAPPPTDSSVTPDGIALLEPPPVQPVRTYEQVIPRENWVAGVVAFSSLAEFDGDRLVALWTVLDTDRPWNPPDYPGPAADLPGVVAHWTTADRTSLALPGPAGTRFIRPERSSAQDPANVAGLVGDRPLEEVDLGSDFLRVPSSEEQIVTEYGSAEYQVVLYRVPPDPRLMSDQVALLFAADGREVTTHAAGIYSVGLDPDQQIVIVRVVAPTLLAVVLAPADADALAIGESVVVRPIDESPVEIDRLSILGTGAGEVAARSETDWGRWELRTDSMGDEQCWNLTTRTPFLDEAGDIEPPFDVGDISGTGSCWAPDEPVPDPILLCSAGGNSETPVLHVVGVVEAGHIVGARLGGQPWPLALDGVDGWVAFYADTAAEPDTKFGLKIEIDGVRANC